MRFYADLHIHSKYSRATSRELDFENLTYWGRKKGIHVIGTGDFTHPAWMKEIKEKLVPAEPGLYRLRPDLDKLATQKLPASCQGTTRFLLCVEISTIYKKGDKVRKIHHLVYAPSIEKAEKINTALGKIGNLKSDGRPILGLDSRHLLEIVLTAGEDCFIIPAHIWTPWFAVLGSKSGFDKVSDCYGDLAEHIFAVETGLSSDPEMNWRISDLDKYRLISNSDAHSPQKLGREACLFQTEMNYYAMRDALRTGQGYGGTVEFFPEEGKYHMDGHRSCGVRLEPEQSRAHHGLCPKCHRPLTLGVLYRIEELADRPQHHRPKNAADYKNLIPLPEVISEIHQSGVTSQRVCRDYEKMLVQLSSELEILSEVPLDQIQKATSSLVGEAISRMRRGEVIRDAGYDGEYGRIKLFKPSELKFLGSAGALFDVEIKALEGPKKLENAAPVKKKVIAPKGKLRVEKIQNEVELDRDQQKALEILDGPLLVMAGPGSGKTRTLTHRVAYLIQKQGVSPSACLTITFTRRAANEMSARLQRLLPEQYLQMPIMTFHALAFQILQEQREMAGLPRGFQIVTEKKKHYEEGELTFDALIQRAVKLLEEEQTVRHHYRTRYSHISIDEYQDIDEWQYRLIQALVSEDQNLCVIGDPDQAIYSFRGANVEFFLRFEKDYPTAKKIVLTRNYRSGQDIVAASDQMMAPAALIQDRKMQALFEEKGKIIIHEANSEKAEAEFIVHTIEKLLGGFSFYSLDTQRTEGFTEKNFSFSDFAVLYRTDAQSATLEEALQRSGIPFQNYSHKPSTANPLEMEVDEWDPRADRLSLLTLHAAKGLEFSVVFIAGCEDGILPIRWNKAKPDQIDEERRLFYVGMTRAKECLFLSHAKKRLWRGKIREQSRSPFLKDIEEKLWEHSKSMYQRKSAPVPQLNLFS